MLAHVAYALPPLTRAERAARAKVTINARFNNKQQVFLDFVLSHYVSVGVEELDQENLTPLLRLKLKPGYRVIWLYSPGKSCLSSGRLKYIPGADIPVCGQRIRISVRLEGKEKLVTLIQKISFLLIETRTGILSSLVQSEISNSPKLLDRPSCILRLFEIILARPMNKEEFALSYHRMQLDLELFRRTGKAFQDFFELVMQKADSSFIMVKPMGKEGDWKADGYSLKCKTVYQCYAPEEMTGSKAAKKIAADFDGARIRWKERMQRWVFVWSSERALPPQVVAALADIKSAYPALKIDHLGRAGLWDIIKPLSLADREALLGIVPDLKDAPMTTAAEIQVLMKHLVKHGAVASDDDRFDLTAIAEKLVRNRLSDAVTNMLKPALPVARLVREFVTSMPDPGFSQLVALDLANRYTELASSTDDPDAIFGSLVKYVLGDHGLQPKFFWAAAGIVTHYFELCEVFER